MLQRAANLRIASIVLLFTAICCLVWLLSVSRVSAACSVSPSYGTVEFKDERSTGGTDKRITVPQSGTYRVWTRMAAPNATNNTYSLEIDGGTCYTVGGSTVPTYANGANTFFSTDPNNTSHWISKTSGGTTLDLNLSAGSHTVKLIGSAPDVVIDKIFFTRDTSCVPTGLGENCSNPPDTVAPVVSFSNPPTSPTSPFSLTVSATDDYASQVKRVELFIDDPTMANAPAFTDTATPFNFTNIDLSPGQHTFKARAYDLADNIGLSTTLTITVRDGTAPTVSLGGVANNETVSGVIELTSVANDNVGVTKVDFLVDGQVKTSDTSPPSPFSASLDTTLLTNGSHQITARAYDAAGNTATSSPAVTVTVSNAGNPPADTTAPTASITSPTSTSGTPIIAGKQYPVSVTATDSSGIKQVIVQVDGVTRATLTTAPYTYLLDTTTLSTGSHTIRVQATDNSNNQNVSSYTSIAIKVTDLADVGRNCIVNYSDISAIIPKLGLTGSGLGPMDVNGDSRINYSDISAIIPKLGRITC